MKRPILLAALALLSAACASQVRAQTLADVPINADTQLFCRDNNGEPQLFAYSNLGGVMRRYETRFRFDMSVEAGTPLVLKFSRPAETPYSITYEVRPYRDGAGRKGLLLDSMHLFLDNADRDITGAAMCLFTEFGK